MKRYIAIVLIFLAVFLFHWVVLSLPVKESFIYTGFVAFGFFATMFLDKQLLKR